MLVTQSNRIVFFDTINRSIIWELNLGWYPRQVTLANNVIYGVLGPDVVALDLFTGEEIWRWTPAEEILYSMVATIDHLIAASDTATFVRRYKDTPKRCSSCHKDSHRGQFVDSDNGDCGACHNSFTEWKQIQFDHNTQSRFPLLGVHARLECSRCHVPAALGDGTEVVQFKPLGRECGDCHDVPTNSTRG